jgi:hypothetical protein
MVIDTGMVILGITSKYESMEKTKNPGMIEAIIMNR